MRRMRPRHTSGVKSGGARRRISSRTRRRSFLANACHSSDSLCWSTFSNSRNRCTRQYCRSSQMIDSCGAPKSCTVVRSSTPVSAATTIDSYGAPGLPPFHAPAFVPGLPEEGLEGGAAKRATDLGVANLRAREAQ